MTALIAFAFGVVIGGLATLVLWPWLDAAADDPADYPETQDEFTPSIARWGYLHDQRR